MGALTKTEIYKVEDKDRDKFVPIRVKAGDIVIHNVKTVHYSEENKCDHPRYTWYLEFRTINQLKKIVHGIMTGLCQEEQFGLTLYKILITYYLI